MIKIAIAISIILIILSYTISHRSNYPRTYSSVNEEGESKSQYECGIEPLEEEIGKETRERIYIKFYIVGILFLIFDLETILLLPASLLFELGLILDKIFIVLVLFLAILLLGLYYEYRKNVL
jgi:NADH-quinone oxidoreductase subunit A